MTKKTQPVELRPADHARAAAEAIRALNHATIWLDSADNYEFPGEVDETVAALETLALGLPQALYQAARWLRQAQDSGRVGHDASRDPEVVAESVVTTDVLLQFAATRARTLGEDLAGVHQETAHLTGRGTAPAADVDSDVAQDGDQL